MMSSSQRLRFRLKFLSASSSVFAHWRFCALAFLHGCQCAICIDDCTTNEEYARKHTHNPVEDAMGNAEALLHMKDEMGLKISWK